MSAALLQLQLAYLFTNITWDYTFFTVYSTVEPTYRIYALVIGIVGQVILAYFLGILEQNKKYLLIIQSHISCLVYYISKCEY